MAYFLNTLSITLTPVCITVLAAMAITIIFKTSYTANFAQAVIASFGAYVVAAGLNKAGLSIWIAMPLGVLAAVALSVFIDVVIFRHGRYVNSLGKQIITMGLTSVIVAAIPLIFGASQEIIPFKKFIDGNLTFEVGGELVSVTKNSLVCVAITVAVIAAIFILLKYSKWGLSVRATASNEYVAGMMGINTHVVTAVSWGLAGALSVLAACMTTSIYPLNAYFMSNYQVNAFLACILGGFATFHGPVIAAIIIPVASSLVTYLGNVAGAPELSGWSMVIVYGLSLLVIFFLPQGIIGGKTVKKV